jgi:hypothetical protein
MNKGDRIVERASESLRGLSAKAAARGGVAGKLAKPLAEDAAFLRKLKPSLIKARAQGHQPTVVESDLPAPPQPAKRDEGSSGKTQLPLAAVGGALVAGIATAKLLDWRGHAHPRD